MESLVRNRLGSVLICFFFAGAAGLIYQVAWGKALGLIFGHTIYAVAVVLAVFMGGLAAGSAYFGGRVERHPEPLALYAKLEFLVAASGLLSLAGLAGVRSLYFAAYSSISSWRLLPLLLRMLGTGLVLLLPTFLMGGTLPVLVKSITSHSRELGVRFSQLYWVNTLGAVIGTLVSGFVLLPAIGLRATTVCAVVLNVLAGLIALRIPKESAASEPQQRVPAKTTTTKRVVLKPPPLQISPRMLLLAFGVIGSTAFAYEIAWTRLLAIMVGSSTYAFTLVLATFLIGIVLGSAIFQRFRANSNRVSMAALARTQIGIGVAALVPLVLFPWISMLIPRLIRLTHETFAGLVMTQFAASALAVLPLALLFGFNFPLVVLLIDGGTIQAHGSAETVGRAYAANTLGAILGSIITGFWLVPWLGTFRVIVAVASVNLLLSLILNLRAQQRRVLPLVLDAVCIATASAIGFSSFFYNQSMLSMSAVLYGNSHQGRLTLAEVVATYDLTFAADGVNDSIAVLRSDNTVLLRVNGKVDASTGDAPTQLLLAHLGGAFHSAPKRVLIIGFGSGMTASAISHYPDVERIDCIEIEPAVIRAAPYLESLNHNVLQDPRVHIIFDDARNFLLTTRERYDLIISEPSNPWIAGIATLFTDEYYAAARARLASGGIFVQWVQAYSLEPADLRMILATFAPHFAEVTLWRGENPDLLLLGRTDTKPLAFDRLRSLWQNRLLQKDFSALSIHQPEGIFAYYLLNDRAVRKLGQGSAVNTDDRTVLEYDAPRALLKRDLSDTNLEIIRQARTGALPEDFPALELTSALEAALDTALDLNDTANAQVFLAALQSMPPSAERYIGEGRLALAGNSLSQAKSSLESALKLEPNSPEAMHWLAVVEHRSGDNALADAQVDQLLKSHPDFLPALEDRMLFAVDRSDFRDAVTAQLDRMALMPDTPASEYCRLGAMWMKLPNLTVAEPVLLKGLLKDPYSYACHLELGELYRKTNRLALARQHFEWVVRFFPDAYSTVYRSLAGVYIALGDTRSAASILAKGRRVFPDDEQMRKAEELLGG